jgi:hypothetical protein
MYFVLIGYRINVKVHVKDSSFQTNSQAPDAEGTVTIVKTTSLSFEALKMGKKEFFVPSKEAVSTFL